MSVSRRGVLGGIGSLSLLAVGSFTTAAHAGQDYRQKFYETLKNEPINKWPKLIEGFNLNEKGKEQLFGKIKTDLSNELKSTVQRMEEVYYGSRDGDIARYNERNIPDRYPEVYQVAKDYYEKTKELNGFSGDDAKTTAANSLWNTYIGEEHGRKPDQQYLDPDGNKTLLSVARDETLKNVAKMIGVQFEKKADLGVGHGRKAVVSGQTLTA